MYCTVASRVPPQVKFILVTAMLSYIHGVKVVSG